MLSSALPLFALTADTPTVSVEHSFGSAVGGLAEAAGATFEARVLLAGIGMTDGWEAREASTSYYGIQGPVDINRYLDGVQRGPIGYSIAPSEDNGITPLDSGFTDGDPWEQHQRIISADPKENAGTLRHLEAILAEAAQR